MDTPDPAAPVPEDPTARLTPSAPDAATPAPGATPEPTAPIPLGAVVGGWVPPSPPPPPAPPMSGPPMSGPPMSGPPMSGPPMSGPPMSAPPAAAPGAAAGGWGPIHTPYGLAWGPAPIPPVPTAPRAHRGLVALSAVAVVISMLVGVGVGYAVWRPGTSPLTNAAANNGGSTPGFGGSGPFTSPSTTPSNSGSSGSGASAAATAVAAKVDPGLVDINVSLGYSQESAAGTGQVLTSSGLVLTNNHVIDEATSISAVDIGNHKTYTASVVGYDRTGDIAVIQLHGASGLATVTTGDSSKVTVGQSIVAIGNAGGVGGTPSVAAGTVTTLDQAITASDDGGGNAEQLTGLIEVDANVQPGDSGGPLVNSDGQVVGIDTAAASNTFSSSAGDGYAIPINQALSIAHQIESGKGSTVVHVGPTAFLGVELQSPDSGIGGFGGLGQGGTSQSGADVALVAPGSPAASAGLQVGDDITSFGGQTVTSPSTVSSVIATHKPGDSVPLVWVDSDGQQHSATVQLGSGPAS